jgi:hypothetical protein
MKLASQLILLVIASAILAPAALFVVNRSYEYWFEYSYFVHYTCTDRTHGRLEFNTNKKITNHEDVARAEKAIAEQNTYADCRENGVLITNFQKLDRF